MKIGWTPLEVHNISNIYKIICNSNNSSSRHKRFTCYQTIDKESENIAFAMFKPLYLHVLVSRLGSTKGQPFEFGLGSILMQEMGSYVEGSKNPITQTNTPKHVEKVVAKVQVNTATEVF